MLSSNGEVKIHNILTDYDIPFEEEYTFDDLVSSSGRHLRFWFCYFWWWWWPYLFNWISGETALSAS